LVWDTDTPVSVSEVSPCVTETDEEGNAVVFKPGMDELKSAWVRSDLLVRQVCTIPAPEQWYT